MHRDPRTTPEELLRQQILTPSVSNDEVIGIIMNEMMERGWDMESLEAIHYATERREFIVTWSNSQGQRIVKGISISYFDRNPIVENYLNEHKLPEALSFIVLCFKQGGTFDRRVFEDILRKRRGNPLSDEEDTPSKFLRELSGNLLEEGTLYNPIKAYGLIVALLTRPMEITTMTPLTLAAIVDFISLCFVKLPRDRDRNTLLKTFQRFINQSNLRSEVLGEVLQRMEIPVPPEVWNIISQRYQNFYSRDASRDDSYLVNAFVSNRKAFSDAMVLEGLTSIQGDRRYVPGGINLGALFRSGRNIREFLTPLLNLIYSAASVDTVAYDAAVMRILENQERGGNLLITRATGGRLMPISVKAFRELISWKNHQVESHGDFGLLIKPNHLADALVLSVEQANEDFQIAIFNHLMGDEHRLEEAALIEILLTPARSGSLASTTRRQYLQNMSNWLFGNPSIWSPVNNSIRNQLLKSLIQCVIQSPESALGKLDIFLSPLRDFMRNMRNFTDYQASTEGEYYVKVLLSYLKLHPAIRSKVIDFLAEFSGDPFQLTGRIKKETDQSNRRKIREYLENPPTPLWRNKAQFVSLDSEGVIAVLEDLSFPSAKRDRWIAFLLKMARKHSEFLPERIHEWLRDAARNSRELNPQKSGGLQESSGGDQQESGDLTELSRRVAALTLNDPRPRGEALQNLGVFAPRKRKESPLVSNLPRIKRIAVVT